MDVLIVDKNQDNNNNLWVLSNFLKLHKIILNQNNQNLKIFQNEDTVESL